MTYLYMALVIISLYNTVYNATDLHPLNSKH